MKASIALSSLALGALAGTTHADAMRPAIDGVSHIAIFASDREKAAHFYAHDLGAYRGTDPENPAGVRYYFSATQFVEVLPLPAGSKSINRLDHVAFSTPDAKALRRYLLDQKVHEVGEVRSANDGEQWFEVQDPEGNRIEFMQAAAHPHQVSVNRLSSHIIHVGFIIHSREIEDGFFRKILGFRPYWFGGMHDDAVSWVSQQVPDGTDWLEYMVVGDPKGRGIPADMKASDLGVLDHFSLGVKNIEVAYTLLWNGDRLAGQDNVPKIGRDAKWQLNLLDPDGTRAEIMELHAIGKPCCSPFTAADPQH